MTTPTKLDPATLTAEERARVDFMAAAFYVRDTHLSVEKCYEAAMRGFADLDRHSRALFAEPAQPEPFCRYCVGYEVALEESQHSYDCKRPMPAQPEPKREETKCPNCEQQIAVKGQHEMLLGDLDCFAFICQPAAPVAGELPLAVQEAVLAMRFAARGDLGRRERSIDKSADALESFWRDHIARRNGRDSE